MSDSVSSTSMDAPYDVVRPVRCMGLEKSGRSCTRRHGSINWDQPGTVEAWKCDKCGTQNVIRIVSATRFVDGEIFVP